MEGFSNIQQPIQLLIESNKELSSSFFLDTGLLFDTQFIKKKFNIILSKDDLSYISFLLKYTYYVQNKLIHPIKYKQFIRKSIFEYYINNKMKIKLYEFSQICAKILDYQLDECLHIHYYLIYNKFASSAYINRLIKNRTAKANQLNNLKFDHQKSKRDISLIKSLKNTKQSRLFKDLSFQTLQTQLSDIFRSHRQMHPQQKNPYTHHTTNIETEYQIRTQTIKLNEKSGILHTLLNDDDKNIHKTYKLLKNKNNQINNMIQQVNTNHLKFQKKHQVNQVSKPFFLRQNFRHSNKRHKVTEILKQTEQFFNQQKNASRIFDSVRNQIIQSKAIFNRKNERHHTQQKQNNQKIDDVIMKKNKKEDSFQYRKPNKILDIDNQSYNQSKRYHKSNQFFKFKRPTQTNFNKIIQYKKQFKQYQKSRVDWKNILI